MTKINALRMLADEFLTKRNWWQFHNPKSDAMNIMEEVGELAEHFVVAPQTVEPAIRNEIASEIADVFFASFCFALLAKVDIAHAVSLCVGGLTLNDMGCSCERLQELVLQNLDKFGIAHLITPQQIIISLVGQTCQLADIFVWCTPEQSVTRVQENRSVILVHLVHIMAHLMLLASLLKIDASTEYVCKMRKKRDQISCKRIACTIISG